MLVRFTSVATESITMFGDVAMKLIKMLGASSALPGAIGAEDIPAAVQRLRQQLQMQAIASAETSDGDGDGDDKSLEPPVALTTRAGPLLEILERASAAKAPVMWEKI